MISLNAVFYLETSALANYGCKVTSVTISEIKKLGFDDKFIRKWNYYFSYCEAAFTMRNISVMQLVYTRPNNINR